MSKPKNGKFVVHCLLCGKNFRVGDKAKCGGFFNGRAMCKTGDIQRALDERLPKQTPSNAKVSGDGTASAGLPGYASANNEERNGK